MTTGHATEPWRGRVKLSPSSRRTVTPCAIRRRGIPNRHVRAVVQARDLRRPNQHRTLVSTRKSPAGVAGSTTRRRVRNRVRSSACVVDFAATNGGRCAQATAICSSRRVKHRAARPAGGGSRSPVTQVLKSCVTQIRVPRYPWVKMTLFPYGNRPGRGGRGCMAIYPIAGKRARSLGVGLRSFYLSPLQAFPDVEDPDRSIREDKTTI